MKEEGRLSSDLAVVKGSKESNSDRRKEELLNSSRNLTWVEADSDVEAEVTKYNLNGEEVKESEAMK